MLAQYDTATPKINQKLPLSASEIQPKINKFIKNPTTQKVEDILKYNPEELLLIVRYLHEKADQINRNTILKLNENLDLLQSIEGLMGYIFQQAMTNLNTTTLTDENIDQFIEIVISTLHENKQERLVTEHPTDCNKKSYTNIRNAELYLEILLNEMKARKDARPEKCIKYCRIIRNNIKIILDSIDQDQTLYKNPESVQNYLNLLGYQFHSLAEPNNWSLNEIEDILKHALKTIENLKFYLIPVENQKRSPEIESHRMMEFLKEDAYNSQVLFGAILKNVTTFIKHHGIGIELDKVFNVLNKLSRTMFAKTGTWAGDSAGKPRVTGETIHQSYLENVKAVLDNTINMLTSGINDVPSSHYILGILRIIDNKIHNTKDNVSKTQLIKLKTKIEFIVNTLKSKQAEFDANHKFYIHKGELLKEFDSIWEDKDLRSLMYNDRDIMHSLLLAQSWTANNYHVNIYERTDSAVNQKAVNDILKVFAQKTKSPFLTKFKEIDFQNLEEDEKTKFLNELLDCNSTEGQAAILELHNELCKSSELLKQYSETVQNEIARNKVVANGGYVKELIADGNKTYVVYDSVYKSMIADTATPSDVLSKMFLMRICSNDPKSQPIAHLIPLTEDMEFYKTIKKRPKDHKPDQAGLMYKLLTSNAFMQQLVRMGVEMKKMTAQSDTPRYGGIWTLEGVDYSMNKVIANIAAHPDVKAAIERNKHFAEAPAELLQDQSLRTTKKLFPQSVKIKKYNGRGHNWVRKGGKESIYTVQGHNHTYCNSYPQYIHNMVTIWNIAMKPDTAYKAMYQTGKDFLSDTKRLRKELPKKSSNIHQLRYNNKYFHKSLYYGFNPLIQEALNNLPMTNRFELSFNKAARGEKTDRGEEQKTHPTKFTENDMAQLQKSINGMPIPILFNNMRAISVDLKTRHIGLYDNLTGPAVMESLRQVIGDIRKAHALDLRKLFLLNPELYSSLVTITIGFDSLDFEGFLSMFPKEMIDQAPEKAKCTETLKKYVSNDYKILYNPDIKKFQAIKENEKTETLEVTLYDIIKYEQDKYVQKLKDLEDLKYIWKCISGSKYEEDNLLHFMLPDDQKFYKEKRQISRAIRRIYGFVHQMHLSGKSDSKLWPESWIRDGKTTDKYTNFMMSLLDGLDRCDNANAQHLASRAGNLEIARQKLANELLEELKQKHNLTIAQPLEAGQRAEYDSNNSLSTPAFYTF